MTETPPETFLVGRVQYHFLHVIDFGQLLQEIGESVNESKSSKAEGAHRLLAAARSRFDFHLKLKDKFNGQDAADAEPIGLFCAPVSEGEQLTSNITNAVQAGGKPIFTQVFLKHKASILYETQIAPNVLFDQGSTNSYRKDITIGSYINEDQYTERMRLTGIRLRVFPNCVLGVEIEASYNPNKTNPNTSPISVEKCIKEISQLEKIFKEAVYYKVEKIYSTLSNKFADEYLYRDRYFKKDVFERLSSFHGVIIVDGLSGKDGKTIGISEIYSGENHIERLKAISGILNRAVWSANYWDNYVDKIKEKLIAFQLDEIFVSDGNCSLICFPQYWTRNPEKYQYIDNLVVAFHHLLSWEAVGLYLESYIAQSGRKTNGLFGIKGVSLTSKMLKNGMDELTGLEDGIRLFRSATMIRSMVNHGFTSKVLSQFLLERDTAGRIAELTTTIESVTRSLGLRLNYARDDDKTSRQRSLQRTAIFIAILALISSVTGSTMSCYNSIRARENQGNPIPVYIVDPKK